MPFRAFLESFRVVVEDEEEFACEGAVGCCEDRARDDRRGDILDEARICFSLATSSLLGSKKGKRM